jgi:hypothetical protein
MLDRTRQLCRMRDDLPGCNFRPALALATEVIFFDGLDATYSKLISLAADQ